LKDPGVDGRIILKCTLKRCDGGTDWIDLAQGRDRWRMGGARDPYEREAGFWWGNLRERDHLEDLGVDGRIICICKTWDGA
jgi:hypothetical protein